MNRIGLIIGALVVIAVGAAALVGTGVINLGGGQGKVEAVRQALTQTYEKFGYQIELGEGSYKSFTDTVTFEGMKGTMNMGGMGSLDLTTGPIALSGVDVEAMRAAFNLDGQAPDTVPDSEPPLIVEEMVIGAFSLNGEIAMAGTGQTMNLEFKAEGGRVTDWRAHPVAFPQDMGEKLKAMMSVQPTPGEEPSEEEMARMLEPLSELMPLYMEMATAMSFDRYAIDGTEYTITMMGMSFTYKLDEMLLEGYDRGAFDRFAMNGTTMTAMVAFRMTIDSYVMEDGNMRELTLALGDLYKGVKGPEDLARKMQNEGAELLLSGFDQSRLSKVSMSGMEMTVPMVGVIKLDDMKLDFIRSIANVPAEFDFKIEGLKLDLGPYLAMMAGAAGDDAAAGGPFSPSEMIKLVNELGLNRVDYDWSLTSRLNTDQDTLSVAWDERLEDQGVTAIRAVLGELGFLSEIAALPNTEQLAAFQTLDMQRAMGSTVASASLAYEDLGLVDKLLSAMAAKQDMPRADFEAGLMAQFDAMLEGLKTQTPALAAQGEKLTDIRTKIAGFLSSPGRIEISADPETPLTFGQLASLGQEDQTGLLVDLIEVNTRPKP